MRAARSSLVFVAVLTLGGTGWYAFRSPRPPARLAPIAPAAVRIAPTRTPSGPAVAHEAPAPNDAARSRLPRPDSSPAAAPVIDDLFARLLPSLLAVDPAAAADTVERWAPGVGRDDALARFARLWAATDPDMAMRWAAGLPADERRIAGESLVTHFAATDPASALLAAEFFDVHQGDGRAERIMQSWTEQDAAAAIAWLASRPPGPPADRLATRIAWTLAQRDPSAAAAFTLEYFPPGAARDVAVLAVVRHWAVRDPSAASAWITTLPAGPQREHSLALLQSTRASMLQAGP